MIKDVCKSNCMNFAEFEDLVQAEGELMGKQHKEGTLERL